MPDQRTRHEARPRLGVRVNDSRAGGAPVARVGQGQTVGRRRVRARTSAAGSGLS